MRARSEERSTLEYSKSSIRSLEKVRRFDWCDAEEREDMAGSSIGFFVAKFVKKA